ncbi:ABC transporter permease subunit [Natronosalvus halobius]|uniref:ABC transporter permease subunit n=1 Tax=Natronosalvus halobius TaxID=2953746 RepID=UPI00209E3134|nr:ABC transporter permease subunit [Natronosalvus halobius]USZ72754.1 ABC transporter permease subunit [Natronosalvus halobius]
MTAGPDSSDAQAANSVDSTDSTSRTDAVRGFVRRTARIARWEVSRSAGTVDRKTILIVLVLALVVGAVGFATVDEGVGLEDGLYTVAVDEESLYHAVAVENPTFTTVEPGTDADVHVYRGDVIDPDRARTSKERAAYAAFADAVEAQNEERMYAENDRSAAFPVSVILTYQQRSGPDSTSDRSDRSDSSDGGSTGSGAGSTDGGDGTGADGSSDGNSGAPADSSDGSGSGISVPEFGGGSIEEPSQPQTPGSITPPFPFRSLVLAFLFVVPMNVVIQSYGSTIMDERIKRRGELLLVSPASRYEIVAGKTLPYLLALLGIVVVIAHVIEGSWLSVAAVVPIALAFLAATFVGAMFARSFKELTFVTVTVSVVLTTYAFVPAIFTNVTPISLISPLTLVVLDLQGESVRFGEYLFSTSPLTLGALVLFGLGLGSYREEDMFTQKPIPSKAVDAVAAHVRGYASVLVMPVVFIPFVFAGQLLTVALVFALPQTVSLPVVFVVAALLEELAKSLHVYAGYAHSRFESSVRTAVVLGALSGLGFFLGEKLTHAAQFVGLPDLLEGQAAFGPSLSGAPVAVVVAVFLAPLALHVVTAIIGAIGASRGRTAYALGLTAATLVHAVYNLGVIALVA